MGRINSPFPSGVRHSIIMSDKATLTFDIFEPENPHPDGGMDSQCAFAVQNSQLT